MDETRTYSSEEVERIVRLAFELRSQRTERATLAEIEISAADLGLEPEFIREAARSLEPESLRKGPEPTASLRLHTTFLVATVIYVLLQAATLLKITYDTGINSTVWSLLISASILWGLTFPARYWARLVIIPIFTTFILMFLLQVIVERLFGQSVRAPQDALGTLYALLLQIAFASLGFVAARLAEAVYQRSRREFRKA